MFYIYEYHIYKISNKNKCGLVECYLDYDEVVVIMERKLNFILINKFRLRDRTIQRPCC